jgi:hypothetical protein
VCAWRLDHNGELKAEPVGSIPRELDPTLRAELIEFLRVCGERWALPAPAARPPPVSALPRWG